MATTDALVMTVREALKQNHDALAALETLATELEKRRQTRLRDSGLIESLCLERNELQTRLDKALGALQEELRG